MPVNWKKGKGKLGILEPLIGSWKALADSEMGPVTCTRNFERILDGKYIRLQAKWKFASTTYDEIAMMGFVKGELSFWSFTSDGKKSSGKSCDVTDVHPEAIGFIAEFSNRTARMIYWPDAETGFRWAVEAKTKKGWNRFVEHHYEQL